MLTDNECSARVMSVMADGEKREWAEIKCTGFRVG